MSNFLENYGKTIFVLVLIAILISWAHPLSIKIKEYTLAKVNNTDKIGTKEITTTNGETVKSDEPTNAVDKIYCIYYTDGELVIAQNQIEPESGRTVDKQGFYSAPYNCTHYMTTVRFEGAVMPKSCYYWFYDCNNLTQIKNMESLYTNECTTMYGMFYGCASLTNIDISHFDTSKVTTMFNMFSTCRSLVNIDVSHFNTSHVTNMSNMFYYCDKLVNINLSSFNTENVTTMNMMFDECHSLTKLDLSSFNTENVTDMEQMFGYCENLVEVNTSESFLIQENSNLKSMFLNCSNLKKFSCSEETKNKILNSKYRTYAYDKMFVCF